jgi:hypothetical protein
MQRIIFPFLIALSLSACASQIMQSYVGKDIREVVMDYGTPVGAFDLADGQRAFQWNITSSHVVPSYSTTNGSFNANTNFYGHSAMTTGNIQGSTITRPSYVSTNSCLYTLIAKKGDEKEQWIVTDFRKPRFMCE